MARRSMPLEIASRSSLSSMMDPWAPLKVNWDQVGVGARRIAIPGVRWAVTISSRVLTPAAVNIVVLQGGNRGRGVEDQERDGVQPRFATPPARIAGKHDSLRAAVDLGHDERSGRWAGRLELALVEDVRVRRHAAGLYPAGKHPLPFGVGLAERDHRLALVNPHRSPTSRDRTRHCWRSRIACRDRCTRRPPI